MFSFDTKENQKKPAISTRWSHEKGCSPLLTPKRRATPEKTEDSRLFGVKIFQPFFRLRRFEASGRCCATLPQGERARRLRLRRKRRSKCRSRPRPLL